MSLQLTVSRIVVAAPQVRMIEFVNAQGGALPAFTAGAHIDLTMGNGVERSYSLMNDPAQTQRYQIAVLRESDSQGGSAWLHESLKEGDTLTSSEPLNHFPLNEAGGHHILIAGGIGVTPMIAMAHRLNAIGAPYQFHYCARSAQSAPFLTELKALCGERLHCVFTEGDPAQRLDLRALLAQRPSAAHVYVCGPIDMVRTVREATADWPKGSVHFELFHGDEAATAPRSGDQAFDIVLNKAGRTLHVPADKKILEVLKAEGFKIKVLCTDGVCGTCKVKLISGKADHRDEVLTDEEREKFIQVCVSRAMPGETLTLDI